jgi:hypothetical protein
MLPNWVVGVFFVAHGWAHVWYIILSQRLLEIKEEVGWTGESWLLSGFLGELVLRNVATVGYSMSLIGFMAGGAGLLLNQGWWRSMTLASAVVSLVTVVLFWDGKFSMLTEKGLIGLLIDVAVILYITRFS